jgi:N-acetylmuramoyl-L-alanine amidase
MRIVQLCLAAAVLASLLGPIGSGFSQTPALQGAIIVVDAGHGGQRYSKSYTGGTRGVTSKTTESELNLRVAFELEKALKAQGAEVFMTRTADRRLSREGSSNSAELHARIDYFELHDCHFFLSVHHNAGAATASGHTALYKHNAKDDTLYEALAKDVDDALADAVPGPRHKLIKGSYHILRETSIPGTISEAGYMTNAGFDELSAKAAYPKKEADAICAGAVRYWTDHKAALIALQAELKKERLEKPRDPKTFTATDLNPEFQSQMKKLLDDVAPGDSPYQAANVGDYLQSLKKQVVTDPKATFAVKAAFEDGIIKLAGASDRKYHDRLIDMLVGMKLYNISNNIQFPKAKAATAE